MRYVVVWPTARFFATGKRVLVTKGNQVPDGVDEKALQSLLLAGAIVAASPPASAGGQHQAEADLSARPAKNATVAVWRAYASSIGITDEDLKGLKKDDLVEKVIAFEDELDEQDDEGDEDDEDDESAPAGADA